MKILSSELLSKYTTFRIGGPARFFAEAGTISDLSEAFEFAAQHNVPYMFLGEGSNMLVSDTGFDGVVIRLKIKGITFPEPNLLVSGAGEHWDDVVATAVSKNLGGIETLSYIPGSVGAAPVQDIGAYGTEVREVIEWVEVFDPKTGSVRTLTNAECRFGYRDSFFKSKQGKSLIITRVAMRLKENSKPNISYKDLASFFAGKSEPTLQDVRNAVIEIRKKKLPDVAKVGTAGSFFKNPVITEEKYQQLNQQYPGMPAFPAESGFKKVPLAWILDKVCNLTGYREGNVGLYETQPLAVVNFGGATATDVQNLSQKIFDQVKNKTGIEIEWEVVAVGNF